MGFVIFTKNAMAAVETDCITEALAQASIILQVPTHRLDGWEFTKNVREAAAWWTNQTGTPVLWGC